MTTDTHSLSLKRMLLYATLLAFLFGGFYLYRLIWGRPFNIDHFADRWLILSATQIPELLTYLGMAENTPLDFHSDKLSDLSPAAQAAMLDKTRAQFEILQQYDRDALSGQQAITYDILRWVMEVDLEAAAFPYHFDMKMYQGPYPANQMGGMQDFPLTVLSGSQQVVDGSSAERFLSRVEALGPFLLGLQSAMDYRARLGVIPPQFSMQRLIDSTAMLVATPASEWGIYQALEEKLAATSLDASEQLALVARNERLIVTVAIPAYTDFLAYLEELQLLAPVAVGMSQLPDGLNYYQALLRLHTSTEMSADEIHALGLRRVEEVSEQMGLALAELGYAEGSVAQRMQAFVAAPGSTYVDEAGVRVEILADYTRLVRKLQQETAVAFLAIPGQQVVVMAEPAETEAGAAGAHYKPAPLDGSSPGIFFANLRDPADTQRFSMLTLAAHEAVPGHHFQWSVQQNIKGIPLLRNVLPSTAFSEGWGLYSERLVYDLGLHDAFSNIGRLQAEMFRAVRLVVDTGIHSRGWTREQAIDYMQQHTGMSQGEVVAEIERYIVMPGQACAYMVGMLEILALRQQARERQGDAFNLANFHDKLLGNGSLPLAILRREVERALPVQGD
ncbi:MAG: DUF885 domain-containing protein [Halioglobus sp.]